MKKYLLIFGLAFVANFAQANYYFVQTGKAGDPTWTQEAIDNRSAILVDLTEVNKTFNDWLTSISEVSAPDIWVAGGTYTFNASAKLPKGVKLYGGFAGTEKDRGHRKLSANGAAAWDWKVKTIFDANACQFFSSNSNTNSTIDGITFQNGESTDNAGAFRTGNNSKVQYCRFLNNTASSQGGAVQVYNANVAVTGCYFEGNTGNQGGAFYANIDNNYAVTIEGCMFVGNIASNTGSAIHMQAAGAYTIKNNVFAGNTTKQAVNIANTATATIVYNTFVNNPNGALTITNGTVTNCVFWGTGALDYGQATLDHNAVQGSRYKGTNCVELAAENTGSTDGVLYPCFTDPANNDYSLMAGSCLISIADANTGITTDIAGTTRNTTPDMGAYEHTCEIPAPSYTLHVSAAGMSTLMLPFTVTELPADVKVYSLTVIDNEISASSQAQINADKPVLIIAAEGDYTFTGEGSANIAMKRDRSSFCDLEGVYYTYEAPLENGGKYNYVLQKQGDNAPAFYQLGESSNKTIKPYRAFLKTTYNANATTGAPMRIRFATNEVTSIENNEENKNINLTEKLQHGEVYDMMGRRVNQLVEGNLYVVEGKKVLFR